LKIGTSNILIYLGLLILAIVTLMFSLGYGSENISWAELVGILKDRISGTPIGDDPNAIIIWEIRFPRILMAFLVGGCLACLGLVRNPLAEPFILGISSGASAGASLFYLGFLPSFLASQLSLPISAFLGALLAISIVFFVAKKNEQIPATRLLLAGIAISSLLGAVTSFVTLASPEGNRIQSLLFWLLGSLSNSSWNELLLPFTAAIVTCFGLTLTGRPLDAMLLGEESAQSLGVNVNVLKKALLFLTAAVTGICVSVSGIIGFVGLIIPHIGRMLVGATHRKLVPFSFAAGSIFLVLADLIARTVLSPQELPIGVVTAICGVPFFLIILRRKEYAFGGV